MLIPEEIKIYVYTEPADMRKSFWGLSGLVNNVMGKDPRSGALFAFFNKRRDLVKLLWYEPEGNARGFSIWMRKLDEGCFSNKVHVSEPTTSLSITISELSFLIEEVKKRKMQIRP